jgi:hypothetical protein
MKDAAARENSGRIFAIKRCQQVFPDIVDEKFAELWLESNLPDKHAIDLQKSPC